MVGDTGAEGGPERPRDPGGVGSSIHAEVSIGITVQATDLTEARSMTMSGSSSPSWATWSSTRKSRHWKRSLSFLCPSRNLRAMTFSLGPFLKEEVLKTVPMQKQTHTDQRTWFKAFVTVGDYNGHVCLDVKCSKAVASVVQGPASQPSSL